MSAEIYSIKPLEWTPQRNGDWYAESVVGQYGAGAIGKTYTTILRCIRDGQDFDQTIASGLKDHLAAKAAAQADLKERIFSAIEFV